MDIGRTKIKKLALASALTAVIFVATVFFRIPVPGTQGGYVNLGDAGIFLAAYLLGGPIGAAAAAIGSAFADLLAGAVVYIPGTAVIKFLMALTAGLVLRTARGSASSRRALFVYVLAAVAGGVVMVVGYALYEAALFGGAYALAALPFNLVQLAANAVVSAALFGLIKGIKV
jgi:uncharacterized membrane protein